MVRRLSVGVLCALVVFSVVGPLGPASAAGGDKQLSRVKGIVGYQDGVNSPFKPIFGRLDLADDAYAVTQTNSQATLRLRDSSEIDLGEKTAVQVGQFNPAETGKMNAIVVNHGALHFVIRHPQGGQSNYTFTTPTSQIAVRGTEAFLVVGPNGTQLACVSCVAGDVSVTTGTQTVTLVTGQTVTVVGNSAANASVSVASNAQINNPAMNQFNNGSNPLGSSSSATGGASGGASGGAAGGGATGGLADPTGSLSGVSSAGAGAAGGAAAGSVAGAVAGAAGAGAAVAAVASNKGGGTSSPTPAPTDTPTPTPTSTPTVTPSPTSTPSPSPGYSALNVSPSSLAFTSPSTQQVRVSQTGPSGAVTATVACNGGASVSISPSGFPLPTSPTAAFNVTASSAPTNPLPTGQHACTITVTGGGGAVATVSVDISFTTIGIKDRRR